jgi:hypothetical protein
VGHPAEDDVRPSRTFLGHRLVRRFEHEDRNQSTGLFRVCREWLEGLHGAIPPECSLITDELARAELADRRHILELRIGVCLQVVVPSQRVGRSTFGSDSGVAAVVCDPHQRNTP